MYSPAPQCASCLNFLLSIVVLTTITEGSRSNTQCITENHSALLLHDILWQQGHVEWETCSKWSTVASWAWRISTAWTSLESWPSSLWSCSSSGRWTSDKPLHAMDVGVKKVRMATFLLMMNACIMHYSMKVLSWPPTSGTFSQHVCSQGSSEQPKGISDPDHGVMKSLQKLNFVIWTTAQWWRIRNNWDVYTSAENFTLGG